MSATKPVLHGRDHEHGGADPVRVVWEDVGGGGGGGGGTPESWALAEQRSGQTVATGSSFTDFDLATFFTNDAATFDGHLAGAWNGIRVLVPGLYKLSFWVDLTRSSHTTGNTEVADLNLNGGGSDYTSSFWLPGFQSVYGVVGPYSSQTRWQLAVETLYSYPTGGTYPAAAIGVGGRQNSGGNATGFASLLIERLGDEVPGGL